MTDNTENTIEDALFDTPRELTRAERNSLVELIEVANSHLIDGDDSRQAAIDALSIASVLVSDDNPSKYGIAPGNVPAAALPPSYDADTETIDR